MPENEKTFKPLDPLLHSELRLAVMSILIGADSADFVYLKAETGATSGSPSVQRDKLQQAGDSEVTKGCEGKVPQTVCRITEHGRDAFAAYVEALRSYISAGNR